MDAKTFETMLESTIEELQASIETHQRLMMIDQEKLKEFKNLLSQVRRMDAEERRKQVQAEMQSNKISITRLDSKDQEKVNVFLEFMDKCENETAYTPARKKMPTLEKFVYRNKTRLWNSWSDFMEDYHKWLNREGHWSDISK